MGAEPIPLINLFDMIFPLGCFSNLKLWLWALHFGINYDYYNGLSKSGDLDPRQKEQTQV